MAHGFVLAGIGAHLGAVHGNGAQAHQANAAGQLHDFNEQGLEVGEVTFAKGTNRAVLREVSGDQHVIGHVFYELFGNLARGERVRGNRRRWVP